MNPRCVSVDSNLCRSLSAVGQVGLAVDSRGDVALAGHVFEDGSGFVDGRRDAIVLKLASADGSTLWTRNIGVPGSHDWSSAVATDRSGNIFVGGQTDGNLFAPWTEGDGQDIWVAKLEGEGGGLLWGYQVGSAGQDMASTLTVQSGVLEGDVIVCGSTTGGLFENPGGVFESGSSGETEEKGNKGTKAFCARLAASDGHVVWGTRFKGGSNNEILAAAVDPLTGDVFAAGYISEAGGSDYVVARLNGHDGSETWRSTGGGGWMNNGFTDTNVRDSACALAVDWRGDVIIAGNTEGALFSSTYRRNCGVREAGGWDGTRAASQMSLAVGVRLPPP
ncbi:conserved unknown protein [Ectocarpus siliculosus]|uniref:Uncharacterized protein n=1 Tax=Ectocarpus siliculosus TaxID=2880 RepID=D8LTJ4_ECTSI|nr:conserved unknown protein [Ectocarpus siliculosus]|eukprot:CBN78035.1 conserved unknown protein [Ectocarpus siliculosus]